jgi:hypothetical protein
MPFTLPTEDLEDPGFPSTLGGTSPDSIFITNSNNYGVGSFSPKDSTLEAMILQSTNDAFDLMTNEPTE